MFKQAKRYNHLYRLYDAHVTHIMGHTIMTSYQETHNSNIMPESRPAKCQNTHQTKTRQKEERIRGI